VTGIHSSLIHSFIEDVNSGVNHLEGKGFKIPYVVNRITIKNSGRVSAEYCEGFFVIGDKRERVSWSHPSERV
jgi:hypothetical protein